MSNYTPLNLYSLSAAVVLLVWAAEGKGQDNRPAPEPATVMASDSSSALASAAWAALDSKNYTAAREAAERCRALYGPQADEMQGKLTALPDKESAHSQWALNDVGTCIFVLGKVADAEGKKEEAMAAYQLVVDKYPYAQCWDEQGWFWQPSVAAKERIAFLVLETE
jgi:hypothetical protein